MNFRAVEWLDLRGPRVVYGVEGKTLNNGSRWRPCALDGKPLVFDTFEQARLKAVDLEVNHQIVFSGDTK